MPSLTFPDFEAYSNAVNGIDGEMRVTGRSDAAWVLNTLEIGDIGVLHGMDGASVTYRGALHAARFGVYLSLPGSDTELEGEQVGDDGYIWMAPRQEMQGFTRVPARFLGVDLAEARVLGQAVRMGLDTQALYRTTHVRSNPQAVAEVVALIQRAFDVHADNPDAFAEPAAQQAFAAQITTAVLQCRPLPVCPSLAVSRRGRPPLPRKEIVRRGIDHIQRSLRGEVPYADLPFAVGASQRSLNRAFGDAFGMAPRQFYVVERLHAIRSALRSARPGDTVTAICARFGVWDLGRMAALYSRLFNILPAQELSRALAAQAGVPAGPRRR